MPTIRTLPRSAFTAYLKALRLPLSAAERMAGKRDNAEWAPTLAFETIEARLETLAGSVLRDDELIEAGEQREAKVVKLKEAKALRSAAAYEKAKGRDEHRRREAQIGRRRQQTNRAARERKEAVKAEAAKDKQAADVAAAKREAAARQKEAAQQKVIDRNERAAKTEALRAESDALDLTDEALQAQETVDLIDATIDGNKEARKTG
ncbi:MAG TPA: hypothetical protein VHE57_14715 [Mycobacteriales bacterium]|nr:hypothetical protein [Mycobacteriales bacterium]